MLLLCHLFQLVSSEQALKESMHAIKMSHWHEFGYCTSKLFVATVSGLS